MLDRKHLVYLLSATGVLFCFTLNGYLTESRSAN